MAKFLKYIPTKHQLFILKTAIKKKKEITIKESLKKLFGSINIETVVIDTTRLFGFINCKIKALPKVMGFFIGAPFEGFEKEIK